MSRSVFLYLTSHMFNYLQCSESLQISLNLYIMLLYILVEKRNCALLKNQLKINIKIKFINCVQYIVE